MGFIGMWARKGKVFQPFWSLIGYRLWSFWSQMRYGFFTLVLNWVCFLELRATVPAITVIDRVLYFWSGHK